ncbi:HalOD1 output domain-containing protein [Natrinema versiforme]|uniref:Halobacterial output domain-containing protein n=1 Tax=Natrinema versiforme TaxID=88724 RepID=A0A4P8WJH8_9EURY|nr:HalOD1 output domain-containing protein [Natrinema versiforme]QCS43637.1 hypothetical protein FEJ81_15240 [Natrinema versiforme]
MTPEIVHDILDSVTDTTCRDADELPPLHDAVDVEALDKLVNDVEKIEFEYAGHTVVVTEGDTHVSLDDRSC